jgi:hypothetical protein
MFTLSIGKIIVIVLVVVALWRGMQLLTALKNRISEDSRRPLGGGEGAASPRPKATELVECPKCGVFVPNGTFCPSKEECRYRPRG